MIGKRPLGTVLALLALSAGLTRGETTVKAEVEPSRIQADATVMLRVEVQGVQIGEVEPPFLSDLEDWTVVNGPSVSSQFRYVNGVSSSARSFTWVLAPSGPGTRTIPALPLNIKGERVLTSALSVEVTAARSLPSSTPKSPRQPTGTAKESGEDLFMRALVDPPDPFVGQQVILRYDLYTQVEVASVPQLQEVPSYPNFWVEEISRPRRVTARREVVEGKEYRVYTIRKVALFPTASGETTLDPVTFAIPVRRASRSRRSFFFDPVEQVYRRTHSVPLQVRPLPAQGRPDDFSNAVGSFRLQVETDRDQAKAGEAVGMTVKVGGTGNLRSVTPPSLADSSDFTVYSPQVRESMELDNRDLFTGSKTWEYILVPLLAGIQELPPVRFSFFDPETEAYETLVGEPVLVDVGGFDLDESEALGTLQRQEIRRVGSDIHFIKTPSWEPPPPGRALYRTAWFWVFMATPPLLNLAALAYRWQRRRHQTRAAVSRQRRAKRNALKRLRRAEEGAGAESNGHGFYRLVAQALTEFVADKFGQPATGLTYDRMASMLAGRAVPELVSGTFLKLLEECDCARFAPGTDDSQSRLGIVQRARTVLLSLEKHL